MPRLSQKTKSSRCRCQESPIVAVFGIAWMAETMFGAHMSEIQGVLGEMVKEYPWAPPLFCCWFPSL
ncbi:anaerobic C4-dicarboxylate transporter family protein [Shigella flexneri]